LIFFLIFDFFDFWFLFWFYFYFLIKWRVHVAQRNVPRIPDLCDNPRTRTNKHAQKKKRFSRNFRKECAVFSIYVVRGKTSKDLGRKKKIKRGERTFFGEKMRINDREFSFFSVTFFPTSKTSKHIRGFINTLPANATGILEFAPFALAPTGVPLFPLWFACTILRYRPLSLHWLMLVFRRFSFGLVFQTKKETAQSRPWKFKQKNNRSCGEEKIERTFFTRKQRWRSTPFKRRWSLGWTEKNVLWGKKCELFYLCSVQRTLVGKRK